MIIPYESIDKDTLRNIILENIVRTTSDFEGDFENEIDKVVKRIQEKEIYIVFSQAKSDVTLVSKDNIKSSQLVE